MSNPEQHQSPTAAVINGCAEAIAHTGAMAEHCRQAAMDGADPDTAALHKRAAVRRAKAIRQNLMAAFAQVDGFIDAMDDQKPRIVRA